MVRIEFSVQEKYERPVESKFSCQTIMIVVLWTAWRSRNIW